MYYACIMYFAKSMISSSFLLANNSIPLFKSAFGKWMAAELPAIAVHSILEIVGGISYEGENVEIREN